MKTVTLNFKTGKLNVDEVPPPMLRDGGILVRNLSSLISTGTERSAILMARQGFLGKAKARPDLARTVWNRVKTEGLWDTYQMVSTRINTPMPLGYSCAGIVEAVGENCLGFQKGDRVACAGINYANHAESVFIPKNLAVPIPAELSFEEASFVTLGAIALQGIRRANLSIGEKVAIIGLGLVGQITAQLVQATGCHSFGIDIDRERVALAQELGMEAGGMPEHDDINQLVNSFTQGHGVDAVLICAASKKSSEPVTLAADICRENGRVIAVGDVNLDLPRRPYYEKELDLLLSRSYGPGRYDPNYEERGHDYPYGYVRWTENRNMASFLELLAQKRLDVHRLITHRYPIERAEEAFRLVTGERDEYCIGIILQYEHQKEMLSAVPIRVDASDRRAISTPINLGVIGAGVFARGILLPAIRKIDGVNIKAVSTARGITAAAVAKQYHANYCTSSNEQVFNDSDIHAVIVSTRHNLHAQLAMEALQAGKHVFMEKPLCTSPEELDKLESLICKLRTSENPAPTLMVGFNRRFAPLSMRLRNLVVGLNQPMVVNYRINAGFIDPKGKAGWVHDSIEGGGRVIGEVCHFVDLLQFVTDATPVSVFAQSLGSEASTLTDTLNVLLQFSDGSLGTISYVSNGDRSFPKERIEVFCAGAVAVLENFKELSFTIHNKTKKWGARSQVKGHSQQLSAFVKSLRDGSPAPIPFESISLTTRITFNILESLNTGKPVSC